MRYAQEKSGQKLHLVYEAEGFVSQPICGRRLQNYRMTINMPLGNSCENCQRIYRRGGTKIKKEFFNFMM